ncbi:AMP-binding protein, partial [Streptomyces afghaniensis]|uniref:AMP-binding protein n=1 Tax=Streptomyces afghaniensis TaxID=66865 RepID=UPI0012B6AAEB
PLTLSVLPGRSLAVRLSYRPDVHDESGARALLDRFAAVLAALATAPSRPVREVSALLPGEREELLGEMRTAEIPDATLPELFARQVERSPHSTAVVYEGIRLTYAELDERSNRLARLPRRARRGSERRGPPCLCPRT